MKYIYSLPFCLLLTGCGDSDNISKVKNHVFQNIDSSRTIGTLMEHRDACKKGSWSEKKDDLGKNIVTYKCDIDYKKINATFDRLYNQEIESLNKNIEKENQRREREISQYAYVEKVKEQVLVAASDLYKIAHRYKEPDVTYHNGHANENEDDVKNNINVMSEYSKARKIEISKLYNQLPSDEKYPATKRYLKEMIDCIPDSVFFMEKEYGDISNNLNRILLNYKENATSYSDSIIKESKAKIEKYKQNPISLSEGESEISFSANPSTTNPVSVVAYKYHFKNHGRDINSDMDVNLPIIYSGNEMLRLKRVFAREIFMDKMGIPVLGDARLQE